MSQIKIKTKNGIRKIGGDNPVFIIAEMSGNHNQSFERAKELVDVAAEAGVDAIKLQTYTADTLTIDCDKDDFQVKVNKAWKGKTLYNLYEWAHTPWEWQPKLKKYAESKGLIFFSTPFDETAVDFLEKMKVSLYKIASFENNHIPLLKKIAQTKKPIIMSRGMTTLDEIEEALETLREAGNSELALLHCVSSYPAKYEQMNLNTIPDIQKRFDVIPGLSDHTVGTETSIAAVALGAKIIEKHFTLSRKDGGPDAAFSLEKEELKSLVKTIRNIEKSLGTPSYEIGKKESENRVFKRSIYAVKDIKKGEKFTEENIRVIRPGYGMHPRYYEEIIGRKTTKNLKMGISLKADLIGDIFQEKNKKEVKNKKCDINFAKRGDSLGLFKIRNNSQIRNKSNNNDEINFENHDKWFKNKYFSNNGNICLIAKINKKVAGYCRLDLGDETNKFIVSIAVDPIFQGYGIGNLLLKKSIKEIKKGQEIIAEIKRDNTASLNLFKKNKFVVFEKDQNNFYLIYKCNGC
jgi:pseudaminic acid synthase